MTHILRATSTKRLYGARSYMTSATGLFVAVLLLSAEVSQAQPEFVKAFAFNSQNVNCALASEPGENYTVLLHNSVASVAYDAARGYGYEALYEQGASPYGDRGGYGVFGPFDDSPNTRTVFAPGCPNDAYDSFIGGKNFSTPCTDFEVGNPDDPCDLIPGDPIPEGIIFRVDVPNGTYRFVAAVGSPDNAHVSRIIAENGGDGPPEAIGDDFVVLVNNFNNALYNPGTFARVGFGCEYNTPESDAVFVHMDDEGLETAGAPDSPTLEVTEGYIRIHQLQGNSSAGPNRGADANGGNMVLLELWRVDGDIPPGNFTNVARLFTPDPRAPGESVTVELDVTSAEFSTTIVETVPAGWSITDNGGGTVNGNEITFVAATDTTITYTLQSPADCGPGNFSAVITPEGGCVSTVASSVGCRPLACGIQSTGAVSDMLIIGPIDILGAGPNCDDNGLLGTSDYLADEKTNETNILVEEGDELAPDFGGLSAGIAVEPAFGLAVNPDWGAGILQVWLADADLDGLINFNDADNVGDPVDDYVIYSLTYLENTTDECLDVILEVGSDDAVKLLVNGSLVRLNSVCRGVPGIGAGDMVPVTLAPGKNVVLIAVVERGGGTGVRLVVRGTDGLPLVDGSVTSSCTPPESYPSFTTLTRSIDPSTAQPDNQITVTLSATNISGLTEVADTFPIGMSVVDAGGGTVDGNTITFMFQVASPLEESYILEFDGGVCPPAGSTFSGTVTTETGCGSLGGQTGVGCIENPCESDPDDDSEMIWAFGFGSRALVCPTFNVPDENYTMIVQGGDPTAIEYDPDLGYGYDFLYDPLFNPSPYPAIGGWEVYGPFDNSPNGRNKFPDTCPEEIYDSFIGCKNFLSPCDQFITNPPDPDLPCDLGDIPDVPEGIIFKVDVPNGRYRFVAAIGDVDNVHAHRILVEDGGEGPPEEIGPNHVVLVSNYDQAQQTIGETEPGELGEGVFARVGFGDKIPPPGDGVVPSPQFINMDDEGLPTEDCPDSPILEVNEGYIRIHQLQGNSNDGPGGPFDANGGDLVVFEIWKVESDPVGTEFVRGDADGSGAINITDGIFILNFLFLGGPTPSCKDAADADDSNAINITDGIYVLNFLFLGGPDPKAPYPACGLDPDEDAAVDCLTPHDDCGV